MPNSHDIDQALSPSADLVRRFGHSASNVLLAPHCRHFRVDGVDGLLGYSVSGKVAVVLGDPACAEEDVQAMVDAFRDYCTSQGWRSVYVVIGSGLADRLREQGCGLLEFGVEQVMFPATESPEHGYIRDLRKKLKRAQHAGLEVREYRPGDAPVEGLEREMANIAEAWLKHRSGPQTYWSGIDLFRSRTITRWFYGCQQGRVVGVLKLLRLDAVDGYVIEQVLWAPDAPVGISEALVIHAREILAGEGCHYLSFGPAPASQFREVSGFSRLAEWMCRLIYRSCVRVFRLDAKMLYREKYRPASTQPLYLAFDPPVIRVDTLIALARVFHFSLR